ncbi:calcium-translocating P-type ATPase, PMCA-type [Candidatus Micrarchaeota archaeon]|nr:MAG: calcium-translocating P-type ATPase, PMCA-type [Candidatus Micrarchaeota archaeon]
MDYYSLPSKRAIEILKTSVNGLSETEAKRRLKKFGYNEIRREEKHKLLKIFMSQFESPLVIVLIFATAFSFFIGNTIDALIILAIVILNAVFGFVQEYKADKAIEALRKLSHPKSIVIRNGKEMQIPSRELVPGDIIILSEGSAVPADARIIYENDLYVDESMLTGESKAVRKTAKIVKEASLVSERLNMLFKGSLVVKGNAKAVVCKTGMDTEIGKIAHLVESTEKEETPLQKRLAVFSKNLGILILFIIILIFIMGVLKGIEIIEMILTSISLAVAVIPEGLPAIVTLALAFGIQRMARKKSLVKRLPIVETLGSATYLCVDKTGTITENKMTVEKIYADNKLVSIKDKLSYNQLKALKIGALCNNSKIVEGVVLGDPTENALLEASIKAGIKLVDYKKVKEVSFSSERKKMTVVYERKGILKAYMKGAPEIVIENCSYYREGRRLKRLTKRKQEEIMRVFKDLNSKALRVLAMAVKEKVNRDFSEKDEKDFVFVGLIAMRDPPREGVKEAIENCEKAGISVIMITGDHEITAKAIAEDVGLLRKRRVVNGRELEKMSDEELKRDVRSIAVFARVSPQHKLRIVRALQQNGEIVGMTGDGVNDAPALKKADIGIAMGMKGTDVAKEAADMVIEDDDFTTIVEAVKEGRVIYDNIKKSITYLLSCNSGEVLAVASSMMAGLPLILLPVQILWMNLITDGLPALALSVEKAEKDVMKRKPNPKEDNPLNREEMITIAFIGLLVGIITVLAFYWELNAGTGKAGTVAFTTIVFLETMIAVNFKSKRRLSRLHLLSNKWMGFAVVSSLLIQVLIVQTPVLDVIFKTTPLHAVDWIRVILLTVVVFSVVELWKTLRKGD